ncbi:MAG: hypothetical protein AAFV33_25410, partial [Chloroflexota bacterium]
ASPTLRLKTACLKGRGFRPYLQTINQTENEPVRILIWVAAVIFAVVAPVNGIRASWKLLQESKVAGSD